MRSRRARRTIGQVVALPSAFVVVLALATAGCGGNDLARGPATSGAKPGSSSTAPAASDPALRAQLARAVARTTGERSARTSISVTVTGLGNDALSSGAFDVAGTGVVDFGSGAALVSASIPVFDRTAAGGVIEQRVVGGVVYTKLPAAVLAKAGLPATVRWLRLDPARVDGTDASALSQVQVNPAGQLAFLDAASDDVRLVGADPVRGVPTTRYTATIDLSPHGGSSTVAPALRTRLAPLAAAIGSGRISVDAWLDHAGCVRRVVVSIPLAAQSRLGGLDPLGPDAMMRIQADYFAFGAAAQVSAPPAAQVRAYDTVHIVSSTN